MRVATGEPVHPLTPSNQADALFLAVHWSRIDDVLNQAGDLSNKNIVTCSLRMNHENIELVVAQTSSGAEEFAKKVPKAKVVYALNTVAQRGAFWCLRTQTGNKATESGLLR